MPSEKPLVYLILGAAGSSRRALLADLLDGGLAEGDRACVLLPAGEAPGEEDAALGEVARWSVEDGAISAPDEALDGATHIFFLTDGRRNPIDQIEAFKPWMESRGAELGRVICLVNCQLAERHREMIAWYEACIYFSDIVVLARREGVANKWLSDFQNRFRDQFFPCLFELMKNGRVKSPALILTPEPRRMSHYFDEPDWLVGGVDAEDDIEAGEGDDDAARDNEEEVEVTQAEDPYMERLAGGHRIKVLPDVAKFLGDLKEKAD